MNNVDFVKLQRDLRDSAALGRSIKNIKNYQKQAEALADKMIEELAAIINHPMMQRDQDAVAATLALVTSSFTPDKLLRLRELCPTLTLEHPNARGN